MSESSADVRPHLFLIAQIALSGLGPVLIAGSIVIAFPRAPSVVDVCPDLRAYVAIGIAIITVGVSRGTGALFSANTAYIPMSVFVL